MHPYITEKNPPPELKYEVTREDTTNGLMMIALVTGIIGIIIVVSLAIVGAHHV